MQQEEAGQRERLDYRQLLFEPGAGFAQRDARVALAQTLATQFRQATLGGLVLDAWVAVAEIASEVEVQLLGQGAALGHRLWMVAEAGCHRRHEGVLERDARGGVGVDVATRHAAQAQARGEHGECAVAGAVAGEERALQLDAQPLGVEGLAQSPHAGFVVHAVLSAAGQAGQTLGVRADCLERDARRGRLEWVFAGMGVGERHQAAEVAPAALGSDQQREVAAVGEAQFGAVDRAQPKSAGGMRKLHRAVDAVVVGQRKRLVAKLERGGGELFGQRGAVEE